MNREKIKARRERILGLLVKGLTETDIAQVLQSSQPTISRDIQELKEQSKDFVNDVAKYFGYYYQESIQGIQQVKKEAWIIAASAGNQKIKLEALSLAKDCYREQFNLLSDGPTVMAVEKMMRRRRYEKASKAA